MEHLDPCASYTVNFIRLESFSAEIRSFGVAMHVFFRARVYRLTLVSLWGCEGSESVDVTERLQFGLGR